MNESDAVNSIKAAMWGLWLVTFAVLLMKGAKAPPREARPSYAS